MRPRPKRYIQLIFGIRHHYWTSRQDTYVSVLGVLKSFGGKRHISAQNIRRVEDFNEVHYHLLEALYISLTLRNPNKVSNQQHASAMLHKVLTLSWTPPLAPIERVWEGLPLPQLELGTRTPTTYLEATTTHRTVTTTDGLTNRLSIEPS